MRIVLPAQFQTKNKIDNYRKILMNSDEAQGIITRYVTLQKNGINYRGILVGRESNILNGNWALHAVGNNIPVEYALPNQAIPYLGSSAGSGFNVLLINEPNVGGSEGVANPENMANSQEIGISFLESAVRAKKIVLTGHSIGGASIGQVILQHDFKPSIDYLVIRLMTFDTLRHMAQLSAGNFGERIVDWLDYDMDSVAASRKLQDQKIPEIIIQGEKDGIMEHATLLDALQKEGITQNKSFHTIPNATHNYFPHDELNGILFKKEKPNIETNLSTWLSKIPGFGFLKALLKKSAS